MKNITALLATIVLSIPIMSQNVSFSKDDWLEETLSKIDFVLDNREFGQAIEMLDQALEIYNEDGVTLYSTRLLNRLGYCYSALKDYNKAIEYYKQSSEIWENTYGILSNGFAYCQTNIGLCYHSNSHRTKSARPLASRVHITGQHSSCWMGWNKSL